MSKMREKEIKEIGEDEVIVGLQELAILLNKAKMKRVLKAVLVGIVAGVVTGATMTKIGEKVWKKVRDNIADDEEKNNGDEVIENTEE